MEEMSPSRVYPHISLKSWTTTPGNIGPRGSQDVLFSLFWGNSLVVGVFSSNYLWDFIIIFSVTLVARFAKTYLFLLSPLEDKHILVILLQLLKFKYKINLKIDAYLLCLSFLRDFNCFFVFFSIFWHWWSLRVKVGKILEKQDFVA